MRDFVIKYWLEFLFSSGVCILGFVVRLLLSRLKRLTLVERGMEVLLKDRIVQAYNKHIELGYCPIFCLECVCEMYEQYHALGGNGTVTKLVEEMKQLPTQIMPKRQEEEK